MDPEEFVREVLTQREEFVNIVNEPNNLKIPLNSISLSTRKQDKRILITLDTILDEHGNHVFDEHRKKLFLFNSNSMKHKKRYSGKPYFIHPSNTAYIVSLLTNPNERCRDESIGYSLTHDFIDVSL